MSNMIFICLTSFVPLFKNKVGLNCYLVPGANLNFVNENIVYLHGLEKISHVTIINTIEKEIN